MGPGDQLVEVFKPLLIFRQDDQMEGRNLLGVHTGQQRVDAVHGFDAAALLHFLDHAGKNLGQHPGIVTGPVMVEGWQLEVIGHGVQLVIFEARIQRPADGNSVD